MSLTAMLTQTKKVSNVGTIAKGQTAVVTLPRGNLQHADTHLEIGGMGKTDISNIEVNVGAKTIQSFKSVAHMEAISSYYGRKVDTDQLDFHFRRTELAKEIDRNLFSLGMLDVPQCQIQFDIGNGAGVTTPTVDAYSRVMSSPDKNKNILGAFCKVKRFTKQPTGAGEFVIDDIPREGFLMAVHLVTASDNINSAEVEVNGVKVMDRTSKARMEKIVESHGRTKQANIYHIDFMDSNEVGGQLALSGADDFRILLDMAGADVIEVYAEIWSAYGGI